MNSAFKKVGVRIGVSDLCFAKLTKDDHTGTTYDSDIHSAPGVVEIALTANTTEDQLGADDNPMYDILNSKDGFDVSITMASLGSDGCAYLLGSTIDANGVEVEGSDDIAPYVAAGFKSKRSDGSYDYIWLLKGKFAQGDSTYRTAEQGTVNWQTPVLNGKFAPRISDKKMRARVNSKNEAAANTIKTFFDSVYSPSITAES